MLCIAPFNINEKFIFLVKVVYILSDVSFAWNHCNVTCNPCYMISTLIQVTNSCTIHPCLNEKQKRHQHTLLCGLGFPWTRLHCIRRSQYRQVGHWCHHCRCLSENRVGVKWNLFASYHLSIKGTDKIKSYDEINAITNTDKTVFTFSISTDSSKSVTSLADTWMLSESLDHRYLKHHSRMKLGQGLVYADM